MLPILIIDDDTDDLQLIKLALEGTGFDHPVISFSNPLSALGYLRESYKELLCIISDINMPLMDGFELHTELRKSRYAAVPYILLSTSGSKGELALAKLAGIHDCLTKPPSYDELVQLLTGLLLELKASGS